ncbi:MAG TPA: MFS transporter [Candidatus Limnocylindrales bacterium]|nr:MFS transporter [Candidatus Limnocylindrales bacterium]
MIPPKVRAALAYAAFFAAAGAWVPYLTLYYRELGFQLGEIGGLLAIASFVGLVSAPVWGSLSDRRRGSPYVLVAAVGTSLAGTALLAFGPGLLGSTGFAVPIGAGLLGCGIAGTLPIIDARALETAGAARNGYGPLRAWGSVGYVISALATGALVQATSPRSLLIVQAIFFVATAAIGLTLRPPAASARRYGSPLRDAGRLFGPRGLGVFVLGSFLAWLGMQLVLSFTPLRFDELHAGATIIGLGGAIAAGIEVPLMLLFPLLATRVGANRLLIAGAFFLMARSIVAALATSPELLLAASVFAGFGYALFLVAGVVYVSTHVPPELAATAQGIFQGVGSSLAQVTAAAGGGAIAALAGLQGLFALAAGLGVGAMLIVAFAVRSSGPARYSRAPIPASETTT